MQHDLCSNDILHKYKLAAGLLTATAEMSQWSSKEMAKHQAADHNEGYDIYALIWNKLRRRGIIIVSAARGWT